MSPVDPDAGHDGRGAHPLGDSAGTPWAGRRFEPNPAAADDGAPDARLLEALQRFRAHELGRTEVLEALRDARLLVPLLARLGESGTTDDGRTVDKSQELAIVTVGAPDGRRVLPAFTGVEAMAAWNPSARPIPVEARRVALAAGEDGTELVVLDPVSPTEFVLRRGAVRALALGAPWTPAVDDPRVAAAIDRSIADELDVLAARVTDGDPDDRLAGPEVVVALGLRPGLTRERVDALTARLSARWSADAALVEVVDSIGVRLVAVDEG